MLICAHMHEWVGIWHAFIYVNINSSIRAMYILVYKITTKLVLSRGKASTSTLAINSHTYSVFLILECIGFSVFLILEPFVSQLLVLFSKNKRC